MEKDISNIVESLQEHKYLVECEDEEGDRVLDIERNLVSSLEPVQVESLMDFFDKINTILADHPTVKRNRWRMSMLKKIGGREPSTTSEPN